MLRKPLLVALAAITVATSVQAAETGFTITPIAQLAAAQIANCNADAPNYTLDFGLVTPGQTADALVTPTVTCDKDVSLSVNVGVGTYSLGGVGNPVFSLYRDEAKTLIWAGNKSFAAKGGVPTQISIPARMLSSETTRMNDSAGVNYAGNPIEVTVTY